MKNFHLIFTILFLVLTTQTSCQKIGEPCQTVDGCIGTLQDFGGTLECVCGGGYGNTGGNYGGSGYVTPPGSSPTYNGFAWLNGVVQGTVFIINGISDCGNTGAAAMPEDGCAPYPVWAKDTWGDEDRNNQVVDVAAYDGYFQNGLPSFTTDMAVINRKYVDGPQGISGYQSQLPSGTVIEILLNGMVVPLKIRPARAISRKSNCPVAFDHYGSDNNISLSSTPVFIRITGKPYVLSLNEL